MCIESSITTHNTDIAKDSCKILGSILYNIINKNTSKENLMEQLRKDIKIDDIHETLHDIYNGKFIDKKREEIFSTGYAVHSLEAALYSFFKFDNFTDSILFSGNLGNDTDTIACITGKICGCYYGINAIPKKWITKLVKLELLIEIILNLIKIE